MVTGAMPFCRARRRPGGSCLALVLLGALCSTAVAVESEDDSPPPLPIEKLDSATRAKALAAIAALVILGFAMIALTWLGARVTRRYMNPPDYKPHRSKFAEHTDDWAEKPLDAPRDTSADDSSS